jgi:hypothetical protein
MATVMAIDEFKAHLQFGGARANLFKVILAFPPSITSIVNKAGVTEELAFLCKAASLPASTIAAIPMNFRGRQLQLVGDRTFEPWNITVVNDVDFLIRNAFENWMSLMNMHVSNIGVVDPLTVYSTATVIQLDKAGKEGKWYDFHDIFPTSVSTIEVGSDNENTVEEFTVELQVGTYWVSDTTDNSYEID